MASYTVKRGDSLSKIAASLGLSSWRELYEANKDIIGGNPDLIRPGQTLTVPGTESDSGSSGGSGSGGGGGATNVGGGVTVTDNTVSKAENQTRVGEGSTDDDPDTPDLTILTSKERKFYFDRSTGMWYVSYGLPNSNRTMIFEATPAQMDAIYGEGKRPADFQTVSDIGNVLDNKGVTFAGDITEMSGTGTFESLYSQAIAKAMDDGVLPSWMDGNDAAMDILFIAQTEDKSTDWVLTQLSGLPEFRKRFPGLKQWAQENNLTLDQAITGFLEFETGMKALETQFGGNAESVTPGKVSALMQKGYSITEVQDAYKVGKRLQDNQESLAAFNAVLEANGMSPLTGTDMVKFLRGQAPAEVYDIYEAASFQEGATAAGIGGYFSAEDAYRAAQYTEGSVTLDGALQGMNAAAQQLLRYRHELDMNKYGLDHEDLVDVSLGLPPRSGATAADILDGMNRAASEAAANRGQFQARPFTTFTGDGRMGSLGVSSGRAEY